MTTAAPTRATTPQDLVAGVVEEDVAFGPVNQGLAPQAARDRAHETLCGLGIQRLAHRPGCNLSGGEQKLAALATVLAMQPKLLLLDEPTNDLDPSSAQLLRETLLGLGLPFVAVSHDAEFLSQVCTATLRLLDGKLTPQPL